jgi:hypothetical protein
MKRGQEVYFIIKGVVRKGIIEQQDGNSVKILYKRSNEKVYTFKKNEVAVEIERGIDGVQGSGKSSSSSGDNGRNIKNSGLCKPGIPNGDGKDKGNQVFVGAWSICNMA